MIERLSSLKGTCNPFLTLNTHTHNIMIQEFIDFRLMRLMTDHIYNHFCMTVLGGQLLALPGDWEFNI